MVWGLPWWIYVLIFFIFFSAYMSYRAMRAEQELEQQYIEKEGEIYIQRIRKEREKRKRQKEQET